MPKSLDNAAREVVSTSTIRSTGSQEKPITESVMKKVISIGLGWFYCELANAVGTYGGADPPDFSESVSSGGWLFAVVVLGGIVWACSAADKGSGIGQMLVNGLMILGTVVPVGMLVYRIGGVFGSIIAVALIAYWWLKPAPIEATKKRSVELVTNQPDEIPKEQNNIYPAERPDDSLRIRSASEIRIAELRARLDREAKTLL